MNPKKRRWEKRCQQLLASLERKEERKEQKKEKKKKKEEKERKQNTQLPQSEQRTRVPNGKGVVFVLWFLTEGKVGRARHGSDATLSRFCGPYGGRRGGDAAPSPTTQRK